MRSTEVGGQLGTYVWNGICTQVFCSKNPVMEKCKRSKVTIVSPGQLGEATRVCAVIQEQACWQYVAAANLPWSCLANSSVSDSVSPVSSVFHQIRRDWHGAN